MQLTVKRHIGTGSKVLLLTVAAFMFGTSFFIDKPAAVGEWMPLFGPEGGFSELYNESGLSIALGLTCCVAIVVSVYLVGSLFLSNQSERLLCVFFTCLLLFVNHRAILFSSIFPAAICLVWVEFFFYRGDYFLCFFLLATASLFFAPVVCIFPLLLVAAGVANVSGLLPRNLLKSIIGFVLPFALLLSFRFILYSDSVNFLSTFWQNTPIELFSIINKSLISLFLLLCLIFIALHAIGRLLAVLNRLGNIERYAYKTHCMYVAILGMFYFVFDEAGTAPISVAVAAPLGILFAKYFSAIQAESVKIEWIMLIAVMVLERAGVFIR